jgi:DNA polymerase alpha subunit A
LRRYTEERFKRCAPLNLRTASTAFGFVGVASILSGAVTGDAALAPPPADSAAAAAAADPKAGAYTRSLFSST